MSSVSTDNVIAEFYRGSMAQNLFIEGSSDIDLMHVVVLPKDYYFGLNRYGFDDGTRQSVEGGNECVQYEALKFIRLLTKGNPNVITSLFLQPDHYLVDTLAFNVIKRNRNLFLSKEIYYATMGYANSQFHRMEILAPKHAGAKRKERIEKAGHDPKNACHLILLLLMLVEFMDTGVFHPYRTIDRNYLLDIKTGKIGLDEIKSSAQILYHAAEDGLKKLDLPDKPDIDKVNQVCVETIETAHLNMFQYAWREESRYFLE